MYSNNRNRTRTIAILAASVGASNLLAQVNGTWLSGSGSWNEVQKWSSNPQFPESGGTAIFADSFGFGVPRTVSVNVPLSLSAIRFEGGTRYLINGNGANDITLLGPTEVFAEGFSGETPSQPLSQQIQTRLLGTGGFHKTGTGGLQFGISSVGGYSGDTFVTAGTLHASFRDLTIGSSTLHLDGGAFRSISGLEGSRNIVIGNGGGTIQGAVDTTGELQGSGHLSVDAIRRDLAFSGTTMTLRAGNNFSGSVDVKNGSLVLRDVATLSNAQSITVRDRLSVVSGIDNTLDRISDSANLVLRGGLFEFSAGTLTIERVGQLHLSDGVARIGTSSTNERLEVSKLVRNDRSVLALYGSSPSVVGSPTRLRIYGELPTLVGGGGVPGTPEVGIIPFIHSRANTGGSPISPATLDDGYVRGLVASEYTSVTGVIGAVASTANLRVLGIGTLNGEITVNSLRVDADLVAGTSNAVINVTSGAVFRNSFSRIEVPLNFGAAEGIIHDEGANTTLVSPLSGTNGVTFAVTSNFLTGMSTYTGPTRVMGQIYLPGDITAGQPGAFGIDSSPIELIPWNNRTSIRYFTNPALVTFARDLWVRSPDLEAVTFGGSFSAATQQVLMTGNITLEGPLQLIGPSTSAGMLVSGQITGTGSLLFPNQITLTGNNTFAGGTEISNGSITIGSDTALGTGPLWISNSGTISAAGGSRTIANPVVAAATFNIAGSTPITFTGRVDLGAAERIVSVTNTASTTMLGDFANGVVNKAGSGALTLRRIRGAGMTVNAGAVELIANGTSDSVSRVESLVINTSNGATLDLRNNDAIISTKFYGVVEGYIYNARNFGEWNLPGLTSSTARQTRATTLGILLGSEYQSIYGPTATFDTFPVVPADVLIKYTWLGDTDFNGIVDMSDYVRIDNGFNGQLTGWLNGDFDLNHVIDFDDYALIDFGFNSQNGTLLDAINWITGESRNRSGLTVPGVSAVASHLEQFGVDYAEAFLAAVPEPWCLSSVSLASVLLGRRRSATSIAA